MLGSKDVAANVAVKDLGRAKQFYEGTLGLTPLGGEDGELAAYRSGIATIYVYRSEYAGTNRATALTWQVDDIEGEIRQLAEKGVRFEHYDDMPGLERKGDLHVGGTMKIAWFKDPDGNILSVVSDASR